MSFRTMEERLVGCMVEEASKGGYVSLLSLLSVVGVVGV